MKIAIIGSGNVGSTLGRRWAEKGHEIIYGTRDPRSERITKLLKTTGGTASASDLQNAVSESSVVVLAVPWPAAEETVRNLGDLNGKTIVDCINPLAPNLSGLAVGFTTSAAEQVAQWAPGARVVKAFNTTGSRNMSNPVYGDQKASMFICGDDVDAKSTVAGLASDLDFDVVDAGPLVSARYLEPLGMLWISLVFVSAMGEDIAFKLMKR